MSEDLPKAGSGYRAIARPDSRGQLSLRETDRHGPCERWTGLFRKRCPLRKLERSWL